MFKRFNHEYLITRKIKINKKNTLKVKKKIKKKEYALSIKISKI